MKSSLSFTVESFLLFQATLLQYAHSSAADTVSTPSNLSITSRTSSTITSSASIQAISCGGCGVSAAQHLLSFPSSVEEVTTSLSVTVIPYVTVYDDGQSITQWSTYTAYTSGSASAGAYTADDAALTWTTLGTTLTYPTTYLAYDGVSAGTATSSSNMCSTALTSVSLSPAQQTQLIFAVTARDNDALTSSAQSFLDALPTITALVSPFKPTDCRHGLGLQVFASEPKTFTEVPAQPVLKTSVRLLTSQGQAVITRASGPAPPPESQITGDSSGPPPTKAPSQGSATGGRDQPPAHATPGISWAGSTITAGPGGVYNIGGHTLTPGGSAQIIDGTTVSIAPGGSVAVVNGQTSSLASFTPSGTGLALATGAAAPGRVFDSSPRLLLSAFSVGLLGIVIGVYL